MGRTGREMTGEGRLERGPKGWREIYQRRMIDGVASRLRLYDIAEMIGNDTL